MQFALAEILITSPWNVTAAAGKEAMPVAEGRAGAGLLLPQNNFLDKISKRFRGTREAFFYFQIIPFLLAELRNVKLSNHTLWSQK